MLFSWRVWRLLRRLAQAGLLVSYNLDIRRGQSVTLYQREKGYRTVRFGTAKRILKEWEEAEWT